MLRPQFSFKTLLWLVAVVAAFFGGMAMEKRLEELRLQEAVDLLRSEGEMLLYPDAKKAKALNKIKRHKMIERMKAVRTHFPSADFGRTIKPAIAPP